MSVIAPVQPGLEFSHIESSWPNFVQMLLNLAVLVSTYLNTITRSLDSLFLSYRDLELVASIYTAYEVKLPSFCEIKGVVIPKATNKESA